MNQLPKSKAVRPTPAGVVAIFLFITITVGIQWLPISIFTEGESIQMRMSVLQDLDLQKNQPSPPKVMVFGSSRFVKIDAGQLADACGLKEDEILNLSRPGNNFFYQAAHMRKHPELYQNLEMIFVDILPYQIMISPNFTEEDAYFLRHSSPELRWKVKDPYNRMKAVYDLVIPAWSKSQNPFHWKSGIERQRMTEDEIITAITSVKESEFENRGDLGLEIFNAVEENTLPEFAAQMLFFDTEISDVQVASLHEIRELLPKDCKIALISLPASARVNDYIDSTPNMQQGKDTLQNVMNDADEESFHQFWYPKPENLGLNRSHFLLDEIHFSPKGNDLVIRLLASIYKNLMRY
jgi:hypothetical protein